VSKNDWIDRHYEDNLGDVCYDAIAAKESLVWEVLSWLADNQPEILERAVRATTEGESAIACELEHRYESMRMPEYEHD
jgi:hypothetical protein